MFDEKRRFIIKNYQKQKEFSSFLPGIAGIKGIPVWSFYVNRGQGICSFGISDKQNPIMEFYPAHTSYELVRKKGFRTFVKADGRYFEPFSSYEDESYMYVGNNELEISVKNEETGIRTEVLYYVLPEEKNGALVRQLTITNQSGSSMDLEVVDGIPELIPYGVTLNDMKNVTQTIQAWMQVENVEENLPFYRLRASSGDTTAVKQIEEGNFYAAFDENGNRLPVIVDPGVLFAYDTALENAVNFQKHALSELISGNQTVLNQIPCGFSCLSRKIAPGGALKINTLIGHTMDYEGLKLFAEKGLDHTFFDSKYARTEKIADEITAHINTVTADKCFDEYCRQTYLDNLLRGGYPVQITKDKILYIYSRKHGDLERDYNSFSMSAEYCSQGNGNYRDVNQNRRGDLIFSPFVGDYNIKIFYNLIQLDGYNPLVLLPETFITEDTSFLQGIVSEKREKELALILEEKFFPGRLLMALHEGEEELFGKILSHSQKVQNADFSEGYWTDHWTYNLDLVEEYLEIYPEKREYLLYDDTDYLYYSSCASVLPREERYVQTENGVREFIFLREKSDENTEKWVHTDYGKGEVYRSSLMTKLILLCIVKFAALDMKGKGIEMEAGRPGWYDALNGLPSMFGSSMCETYELKRMLLFVVENLKRYNRPVLLPEELVRLLEEEKEALNSFESKTADKLDVWNRINIAKEAYRTATEKGIDGKQRKIEAEELADILSHFSFYLDDGISQAVRENKGIPPAYCSYHMDGFEEKNGAITFHNLTEWHMPDFLEGPVRFLKLPVSQEVKKSVFEKVRNSDLYDKELKMYKINTSLEDQPQDIGRARAFGRGWLENESIWLHMEYKYLLELLKSGMYKEFFDALHTACVPFMDYRTYGRSLTENSSFIASSVNENKSLHGRGFVARLSGSTAEFLDIWRRMFFGNHFVKEQEGSVKCMFSPALPEYLIPEDGVVKARLFGSVDVVYHIYGKGDLIPGEYAVSNILVKFREDPEPRHLKELDSSVYYSIRAGKISEIRMDVLR